MKKSSYFGGWAVLAVLVLALPAMGQPRERAGLWDEEPIIGMYVHQHWSYNHPYAARTWTLEDWTGYLTGLKKIGFNSVLIWPMLETMPNPLTPSDVENLEKIARVIDLAHDELDMRVFIVICPNVVAKDEEARKYTFVERPFFYTDDRIDPADAVAMGKMMSWREQLVEPIKNMDGVFIIDSDPGGWPNSNNLEFVSLLNNHRTMLDKVRAGIALYYWIHAGWEAYGRFYATAEFAMGEQEEIEEAIRFLAKVNPEPWGLASGRGPGVADALGMPERVLSYQYGAIEGEPTFPMTNFHSERAYLVGRDMGARGTLGNSQTHCIQLPNAYLFARGATGQPMPERADYVAFAERLLPGHGAAIVTGWEALNTTDAQAIRSAMAGLEALEGQALATGELEGLLFGNPQRFVGDLIKMLRTRATLEELHAAATGGAPRAEIAQRLSAYVDAVSEWQQTHDYKNNWYWPRMQEALMAIAPERFEEFYRLGEYKGEGDTPFEQVKNYYMKVETYTPRIIEAMRETVRELQASN